MALDLQDMADFLKQTPPFDALDNARFDYALDHAEAVYVNQHNRDEILREGHPTLYVVRSGTYDLNDKHGKFIERLETGDVFGFPALLSGRAITNQIEVLADGILFCWDAATFAYLRRYSEPFERYFMQAQERRLLVEHRGEDSTPDWTERDIGSVISRPLISIGSDTSIQQAAISMSENKVSSLLVVDEGQLRGIITDRDIRNRVVAKGMDYGVAVTAVMTQMPEAVYTRQSLFDALTMMNQANIHHLPVLDDEERPVGMITTTDLMKQQRSEPVFLMNALFKAQSREALVEEAQNIPHYLRTFATRVKDIGMVGRLLASLTDGMTRKLIRLYEHEHGAAPVAYAWMAFGSQAREDQTLSSDQDNGLLLADGIKEGQREYFHKLAEFVCTGLADCGIRLCPGDVMAMNPKWNKTSLEWQQQIKKWVQSPTPDAIMHSMIFFDSRMIAGNQQLYRRHRDAIGKIAQRDIFLGNIGRHIGELNVPLGLFNRLRTKSEKGGDYIDIKTQGVAVINDIVRLYSLIEGLTMPATPARLQALQSHNLLTAKDNQNLLEAWQFLTQLRLSHQLKLQGDSTEPVNSIDPETLSTLQRRQLKAAFSVIKDAQQGVGFKVGRGL
ncbi:DUF294 nucleotidyltransferase-like domain-containing protein [Aliidiomarina soli]|uniref:Signal transduction protein n=1 Tax=Aliidiomarina soli TaxID=1928574 RepID=A0A432WCT2_9GAMM|nr:DUF294 nucleotidyltransferase-like domain-containing protein [Aliidiomarina soli]RUO30211.1 hypothetical protein CWE14_12580 [Aliidiomarina soli]